MNQIDLLEAQLRQARIALETARRLQQAAEEQRNAAVEQLRSIAAALMSTEWNLLQREQPVAEWSPEQLGAWIVETGIRKLNRLELLGGNADILESVAWWQAEAERLHSEIERITRERDEYLYRLQVREDENQRLREEIAQLQRRVAAASAQPRAESSCPIATEDAEWLAVWQASPDYARDVEALQVIGQHGYVLREPVARSLNLDYRSGSAVRLFERLREIGLIEEKTAPALGTRGRTPNLVFLTEKGRQAYKAIFGCEPVESEDQRLLRRHKSYEQTMLALQARLILEEHGAYVDLFPSPQPLPGGGVFEVDLVAILDDQKLFIELEMAPRGLRRLDKWDRYARLTKLFYFFVPNRDAMNRLMTELNYWAFRHNDQATGVVVHVCQVSAKNEELWQFNRPLVGKLS
ncbi:hypothetical protein [Thermogutta sp.]|uniref:hypothetical protein n=1 Tax=Thermogutta sp. TaxID=1962930 RepID=UPI00321F9A6B